MIGIQDGTYHIIYIYIRIAILFGRSMFAASNHIEPISLHQVLHQATCNYCVGVHQPSLSGILVFLSNSIENKKQNKQVLAVLAAISVICNISAVWRRGALNDPLGSQMSDKGDRDVTLLPSSKILNQFPQPASLPHHWYNHHVSLGSSRPSQFERPCWLKKNDTIQVCLVGIMKSQS